VGNMRDRQPAQVNNIASNTICVRACAWEKQEIGSLHILKHSEYYNLYACVCVKNMRDWQPACMNANEVMN